jgi:hypothetical protein
MNPTVLAATIGVSGTVIVGVAGFGAAIWNTRKTLAAAREARIWDRRAAAYVDAIHEVDGRRTRREALTSRGDIGNIGSHPVEEMRKAEEPELIRIRAALRPFASAVVWAAYQAADDANTAFWVSLSRLASAHISNDPSYQGALDAMYQARTAAGVADALAHPEVVRPAAHAVTRAPAARWWSGGIDLGIQQYVDAVPGKGGGPPLSGAADRLATWRIAAADEERLAAARPADPAAPLSGYWWSSPIFAGLVCTTTALPGLGALRIVAVEDWPGWSEVLCWPVTPHRPARIYEITGPDDWAALVTRYPLEVTKSRRHDWWKVTGWAGTWLMPDYAAAAADYAAADYEAIHLSVGGYLTTAGRALVVNDARCLLAGWDPDATYWLADVLTSGGSPVRWISDDSAHLGWRRTTGGLRLCLARSAPDSTRATYCLGGRIGRGPDRQVPCSALGFVARD